MIEVISNAVKSTSKVSYMIKKLGNCLSNFSESNPIVLVECDGWTSPLPFAEWCQLEEIVVHSEYTESTDLKPVTFPLRN